MIHHHIFMSTSFQEMTCHTQQKLKAKLVLYNRNLMDIRHTVATLSLGAIKAVIVVLLVWLEIGSNKDV